MIQKNIDMLNYECTLTPLTPIQIGNGNELSPFEYIIKNKEYYRVDINEVIKNMPENIKKQFIKTLEENSMFTARKFLKNNYKKEYGYLYKCVVDNEYSELYENKIGEIGKKNEENQLLISEFIGTHTGKYIPGSTLKGAFRTAYLMGNFTPDDYYKIRREIENKNGRKIPTKPFRSVLDKNIVKKIEARILEMEELEPKFDPFKNFKITDTELKADMIEIQSIERKGMKHNKYISMPMGSFEVTKSLFGSNENIELKFQVSIKNFAGKMGEIYKKSSVKKDKNNMDSQIVKETIDFYLDDGSEILEALNNKAEKILEEDIKFFEKINADNSLKFCHELLKYKNNLKENQALIRIGRGAGFNSTTFNLYNKTIEEVFTRVTVKDMPIGWALITCKEI